VADDHGRASLRADQLADRVVDEPRTCGIELTGRLVREKEARAMCQRCCDRDALLFTARELRRSCVALVREADALEQVVGSPVSLGRGRAGQSELQADQLPRAELGRERAGVVLVCVADGSGAEARDVSLPSSVPKTRIVPADGRSSPASSRRSVDFPDPLGPSTVTVSCSRTVSDSPCSAAASPSAV
jgi:hypothetical protein